jgi:hypothetical protein
MSGSINAVFFYAKPIIKCKKSILRRINVSKAHLDFSVLTANDIKKKLSRTASKLRQTLHKTDNSVDEESDCQIKKGDLDLKKNKIVYLAMAKKTQKERGRGLKHAH